MPLDAQLVPLLQLVNAGIPMHQMDPAGARAAFRTLTVDMRSPEAVVPVGSVADTTVAGAEGPLAARVYRPEGDGSFPTVVLFHGGGWVIGDLDTHDNMARSICRIASAVVVSVDYRLSPESPFPAAADDALAAARDVASRLAEYGGSEALGVAGDSAGGNLSAVVAQQVPEVSAQFLIYPAVDIAGDYPSRIENAEGYFLDMPTMEWFALNYLGTHADLADPRLSPLFGVRAGLAPAVVVTAEFDPLRDDGAAYVKALADAGVPVEHLAYDGLIHGFFDMGPWSAACQAAIEESIARFATLLKA